MNPNHSETTPLQELSSERFRRILESIGAVVWFKDLKDPNNTYVSPTAARVWGRPQDFFERTDSRLADTIHPRDRERYESMRERAQNGRASTLEYRILRPDGSTRWIRDRLSPIFDDNGQVIAIAGVAEDATEIHQLECQLRQAQKMEAIGRLSSGITHDFNNLLMGVEGCARIALNGTSEQDPTRPLLQEIISAVERGTALVSQLLQFSRPSDDQSPEPTDVNSVVDSTERMMDRLLGEHIHLNLQLQAKTSRIQASKAKVEQILMNLLVNSRDALPDGGEISVRTDIVELPESAQEGALAPGRYLELTVSDTGVGMDEQILAHVFEPFFTTKTAHKGTGLGLSTVYGTVRQLGGQIDVSSTPGEGTTFIVLLPLARDVDAEGDASDCGPTIQAVLLVEDDDWVRKVVSSYLELQGYEVLEASGLHDATALLEQHDIAFAITDTVLAPGERHQSMSFKQFKTTLGAPVIFISGYPKDRLVQKGLIEADDPFLMKPFGAEQLAAAIESAIPTRSPNEACAPTTMDGRAHP